MKTIIESFLMEKECQSEAERTETQVQIYRLSPRNLKYAQV